MNIVTAVFVPLCAIVILFAALAVGRLLKSWRAGHGPEQNELAPEHLALLDEKARLMQTLNDLEHEHQLGKLSDADYFGLKRHFERETLRVMDRLEQIERPAIRPGVGADPASTNPPQTEAA